MKPVIVFDVNETLLDIAALDPTFVEIFGEAGGREIRKQWFTQVLQLFLTGAVIGHHRPFAQLADDALSMIAEQQGLPVTRDDRQHLELAMGRLPAHPDVRGGLDRLREAGFTVVALTNSGRDAATRLLERAGLRDHFAQILSAEDVQRHKPLREAYEHAARACDVALEDLLLVAAHSWDVAGALAAGCRAAFVARPGQALSPGVPTPQLRAQDVAAMAERIVETFGGAGAAA